MYISRFLSSQNFLPCFVVFVCPPRRTAPGISGKSGRARSAFRLTHKKSRRGLFPSGRASVPFRIDFDLMLAKEKTSVTLFFVRHPCAAAHRVLHSRFYFFHAHPLDFVSSSSVRGALNFLKMVNSSSAHPLISPSGASSNQALIIALIHSNFFPSKRCREKDAPRGILSKYL